MFCEQFCFASYNLDMGSQRDPMSHASHRTTMTAMATTTTRHNEKDEQWNRSGRVVPPPPAHRYILIHCILAVPDLFPSHSGRLPDDGNGNHDHDQDHDDNDEDEDEDDDDEDEDDDGNVIIVIVISRWRLLGHIQAHSKRVLDVPKASIYLTSAAHTSIDIATLLHKVNRGRATHRCCCPSDLCQLACWTPEDASQHRRVSEMGSESPFTSRVLSATSISVCVGNARYIWAGPAGYPNRLAPAPDPTSTCRNRTPGSICLHITLGRELRCSSCVDKQSNNSDSHCCYCR